MKKIIKKVAEFLISIALKPCAIMWFWYLRWFRHNRMLSALNNKEIGSPSVIYLPFAYLYNLLLFARRSWATNFTKYALKKYSAFLKRHYTKGGLGYFNYEQLSPEDCIKVYQGLTGRISYYLDHNPTLLEYKNGDTFLDAGCGKGQNIKALVSRYPNSSIKGFDVSEEALKIVQTALKDNNKISAEVGSVVDFKYLASYPAGAFDHLIVSHVFAFLIGPSVEETRKIRQMVIDHLVRVAAKTLLIMDGDILSGNDTPEVTLRNH
ncbi:MAG: class I SAM-dependent methyltransferase [Candidatus Omnitrophica bacterium]|nr:class I SAM-dependent methyltransferase [Candidatus Omnitrophota bacterium]